MKVKELLERLSSFNSEAELKVIVHNKVEDFSLTWGGGLDGEGTPKEKTSEVSFYVDRLCQNETIEPPWSMEKLEHPTGTPITLHYYSPDEEIPPPPEGPPPRTVVDKQIPKKADYGLE